ncbi:helix-turn-helix domain-containing protein [Bradyrhizobium septentrionale]|uniref:Helix-turn-helix transcriptional regulator n=1 Tax=Bradyrhizobium septentrionale TaxID=1404411 RepID=A0A973W5M8_9BRAD|nr:helix-turn-helix transcriptional regulator [Bradyrhizobium septentrionale]UGY24688.1 helix-turn-helix domain-containing protein [Bradyrhizobium septentrionale]
MPARKTHPRTVTGIDKIIGNRLRQRRLELHISQSELADKLGVSFQQVQKYEKGVNRIGAGRLQQIANILETDIAYFMGDVVDGKRPPTVSKLASFMATKEGLDINEAMMRLDQPHRKAVIALARTLGNAYGAEA